MPQLLTEQLVPLATLYLAHAYDPLPGPSPRPMSPPPPGQVGNRLPWSVGDGRWVLRDPPCPRAGCPILFFFEHCLSFYILPPFLGPGGGGGNPDPG